MITLVGVFVCGAFAGAYLIAVSKAPDGAEARKVRAEASDRTYAVAQLGAFGDGLRFGLEQGLSDGVVDGEQQGRRAGIAAVESVLAQRRPEPLRGPSLSTSRLPGTGDVLVVGDSLEVGTSPFLDQYLPGVRLTTEAEVGLSSTAIADLFAKAFRPSQSVIVFDAGTNDDPSTPDVLAANIAKVADQANGRCLVIPTIHAPAVNGVDQAGKNRVIRSFASTHAGTQVPDWASAVAARPELLAEDNLHPNAVGADFRAQLIARGIRACLAMDPRFGG
ncbi:MAG: hypothetical protein U0R51_05965 [Solirubrobacterales bacterium]